MTVKKIFHTEEELFSEFSQRFRERWERLLCAYNLNKMVREGVNMLRAASLAWAFCNASLDGNEAFAQGFDDMLHGYGRECLEFGNMPCRFSDDDRERDFIWDVTCLMLEEKEATMPQFAYDVAGKHNCYAYKKEILDGSSRIIVVTPVVKVIQTKETEYKSNDIHNASFRNEINENALNMVLDKFQGKDVWERRGVRDGLLAYIDFSSQKVSTETMHRLESFDNERLIPTQYIQNYYPNSNPTVNNH